MESKMEAVETKSSGDLCDIDYEVNSMDYLKTGWETFKKNAGPFVGFTALFIVINMVIGAIPIIGNLISMGINGPLMAGFYLVAFKIFKNKQTVFGDFFKGFDFFLPLFLAGLVGGLLAGVGILLLILPGIYLAIGYVFSSLLIIDKKMDFWQALEVSRRIVTRHWFAIFLFIVIVSVINLLGLLVVGLGMLITMPVTACALAASYDDIIGVESVN